MRKYFFLIFFISLIAPGCKKDNKPVSPKSKEVIVQDDKVYEFHWYKKTSDYYQKKIAIYGFVLLDTITNEIGPDRFTIYERPNCYKCGETMVQTDVKIPLIMIDDTTFENENKGAQWRLVKIMARVENYQYATIERFEVSEYSYPDYMESGYQKLTNDFLNKKDYYDEPVYIEGKLELNLHAVNLDYVFLGIKQSGIQKDISIYVKAGDGPNTANRLPDNYTIKDLIVRDKTGREVQQKRVRLYGRFESTLEPDFKDKNAGSLHVEMIEVVK